MRVQLAGEQGKQLLEVLVTDLQARRAQRSPQGVGDIHLADPPPVQQSALERAGAVTPEPGIVDVGVVMTQRDEIAIPLKESFYRPFVAQEADGLALQPGNELRRRDVCRQELRTPCSEIG